MALKIGMMNLWADGGILPVSGVTKWVISGNKGTTEEGLLIVFLSMSVCLVLSLLVKVVHQSSLEKFPKLWFLGGRQGPSPLSYTSRTPLDLSLWR